jgi:mannose-6-phosphate isomerase-like protein (cupin superfamily)
MIVVLAEIYHLTAHESVTVRSHSPDLLEVEGSWDAHGSAPPPHLHPDQDERFEVLEGGLTAVVDGKERTLGPGDRLEVPRGAVHKMWNPTDDLTRAVWQTRPAGRTLDWWKAIDRLGRRHPPGRAGISSPTRLAALLSEYDDVIRIAAGPRPLVGAVLSGLAAVGRRQAP